MESQQHQGEGGRGGTIPRCPVSAPPRKRPLSSPAQLSLSFGAKQDCYFKSGQFLTFMWPFLHGLGCVHSVTVWTVQMGCPGSDFPKATAMEWRRQ